MLVLSSDTTIAPTFNLGSYDLLDIDLATLIHVSGQEGLDGKQTQPFADVVLPHEQQYGPPYGLE
jgi:hypothetical protein